MWKRYWWFWTFLRSCVQWDFNQNHTFCKTCIDWWPQNRKLLVDKIRHILVDLGVQMSVLFASHVIVESDVYCVRLNWNKLCKCFSINFREHTVKCWHSKTGTQYLYFCWFSLLATARCCFSYSRIFRFVEKTDATRAKKYRKRVQKSVFLLLNKYIKICIHW